MNRQLRVFNIQHYSVHDGPGIRTTLFLKGCPLSCQWCCNPESQTSGKSFRYSALRCKHCLRCMDACKNNAIQLVDNNLHFDFTICNQCKEKQCLSTCYHNALSIIGTDYDIASLLAIVLKDKPFYDNSGGGITLSGGEPFMQPHALADFLELCKQNGLHTAVETCGFVKKDLLESTLPFIDLFLYDLKLIDEKEHIRYTSQSNQLILDNIKTIARAHKRIIARIPLIPGVTDTDKKINAIIGTCLENDIHEATLGIYHNLGLQKYTDFGIPYLFDKNATADTKQFYNAICEKINKAGIECEIL